MCMVSWKNRGTDTTNIPERCADSTVFVRQRVQHHQPHDTYPTQSRRTNTGSGSGGEGRQRGAGGGGRSWSKEVIKSIVMHFTRHFK